MQREGKAMTHMRRVRSIMCILVAVTLVITQFGAAPAASGDDGRYIVIYADGISPSLPPALTLLGVKVIHVLWLINALAIQIPLGIIGDTVQQLLNNPDVVGVYHDLVTSVSQITPTPAPTGEKYGWNMQRSNVDDVHKSLPELRGTGVTVAILDTGIDPDHPELSPRVVGGYSAFGGSSKDDKGHGTHIAGIIAAAGLRIFGVAPQVSLVAVKVLDQNGDGHTSDLIKGLQYVYGTGIKVVNMSLQFSDLGASQDNLPLERATWRLYNEKGVIMVAAAGNHGCHQGPDEGGGDGDATGGATVCDVSGTDVLYPARFPWIIAVTAIDYYKKVPSYCRYGPEVDTVDMAASGGSKATNIRILSADRGGGYAYASGTSQATAHVSGAVALALQRQPTLDFAGVLNVLEAAAQSLHESKDKQGAGLIDVERMVRALR
jgi:subtilisin